MERGGQMNLTDIIKKIRSYIGKDDWADIKVTIYSNGEIAFEIYETEVPIIVDLKRGLCYVDTECMDNQLTAEMLDELAFIVKLLEGEIEEFEVLIK